MLIKTKPQPVINQLTPEEISRVYAFYNWPPGVKLELHQVKLMPDKDVFDLCSEYCREPFKGTRPEQWTILREDGEIKVTHKDKLDAYIIDIADGSVNMLKNGMRSHLGDQPYVLQFHMKRRYAFPLYFERGHWANGKNALQLGIAIPDRSPLIQALKKLHDNDETLINDYFSDKLFCGIELTQLEYFDKELTEIKKQIAHKG